MKLEFSRQIFEKYSNIKFHERWELSSCMRTEGRIDRQKNEQTDEHEKTDGWTDKQTDGWTEKWTQTC